MQTQHFSLSSPLTTHLPNPTLSFQTKYSFNGQIPDFSLCQGLKFKVPLLLPNPPISPNPTLSFKTKYSFSVEIRNFALCRGLKFKAPLVLPNLPKKRKRQRIICSLIAWLFLLSLFQDCAKWIVVLQYLPVQVTEYGKPVMDVELYLYKGHLECMQRFHIQSSNIVFWRRFTRGKDMLL